MKRIAEYSLIILVDHNICCDCKLIIAHRTDMNYNFLEIYRQTFTFLFMFLVEVLTNESVVTDSSRGI